LILNTSASSPWNKTAVQATTRTTTQAIRPRPSRVRGAFKLRLAPVVIGVLLAGTTTQAADLSGQMASMFGDGTLANVTGPGAYKAQTQNIYVGGDMQLRFPARTYQLYSYSLPKITAGCGGVDIHLGSFSHISEDKFKEMLEAVSRAYAGLLFKAALKSINPLIESVIGDLQKTLEQFSQYANNSCAMAGWLMDQTSSVTGMDAQNSCVRMAMSIWGEDLTKAQARCKVPGAAKAANDAAKASTDPAIAEMADRDMNLIWEALAKSTLSTAEKEVFMNIAGTVVIRKPSNDAGEKPSFPQPYDPSVDSLTTLLNGHQAGSAPDQVVIRNWLRCPDTECLTPERRDMTIKPFPVHVREMLESIRDKIAAGEALTASQVAFINLTSVPIYRMMAVGHTRSAATGSADLSDILIARYMNVVAYDYAHTFMKIALKDARIYLSMAQVQNKPEQAQRDRMIANVNRMLDEIDREHGKALARVRDARALVDDLQAIERDMRLSLPTSIRNMHDIGNLLRGTRG
jgi:conjugative transfer pilus assembly protein TraH